MTEIQIYKDILEEAYKQEIKAKAEMRMAAKAISIAKVEYIDRMITGNSYRIEGLDYYPMLVKADVCDRYKIYLEIEVILCCRPDDIRSQFSLSRRERELVGRYEKEIYSGFYKRATVLNKPLVDAYYASGLYDIQYLKNRIYPLRKRQYEYEILELLNEGFLEEGLELDEEESLF